MILTDRVNFKGLFNIRTYHADGTFDEYTDNNLIMDTARNNMAELIGGVTTTYVGDPINRFVIGTEGHVTGNILLPKSPGQAEPDGYTSTRTSLFSETSIPNLNYRVPFTPNGNATYTFNNTGSLYDGSNLQNTSTNNDTVEFTLSGKTATYVITIPAENANDASPLPYTEAGLYAGTDLFAMKTFPARVKENTVKFVITWSIVF